MDTTNAAQLLEDKIFKVGTSEILFVSKHVVSKRCGVENMDGHLILSNFDKKYARPWNDCIPFHELSKDNLPPFFVRLRDDQVGNLIHWSQTKQESLAKPKFCIFWPFDFSAIRKPLCQLSRILQATNFLPLQAIECSFLFLAIHLRAHFQSCTNRWLTHSILEIRRCLPDSVTIFQLPKS